MDDLPIRRTYLRKIWRKPVGHEQHDKILRIEQRIQELLGQGFWREPVNREDLGD